MVYTHAIDGMDADQNNRTNQKSGPVNQAMPKVQIKLAAVMPVHKRCSCAVHTRTHLVNLPECLERDV